MSLKVREILELAEMKGCSLAAGKGGLDRVVRFVDCMEIPDMKAWMRPNVFYITTGYTYSNSEEEIIQLIRDLYDAKAAAWRQNINTSAVPWKQPLRWRMNCSFR